MAYGVETLSKIQMGPEDPAGTPVAATMIWRGEAAKIKDESTVVNPSENVGYIADQGRVYIPEVKGSITFPQAAMNFEQGPYPFASAILALVTGAANGGTSNAKKYPYILNRTTGATYQPRTIESGDNAGAERMSYCFCENIKLSGVDGQAVMIDQTWRGRQRAPQAFTALTTLQTVETILHSKGKIYIDATTIGSTQITGSWLGFELNIDPGLRALPSGDGDLFFRAVKAVKPVISGKLVFEHDDIFAAAGVRKIRMQWDGSATGFTGSGGTFTARALQIDMAAYFPGYDDSKENGDNITNVNFNVVDDGTLFFSATFCNLVTALV
jgi:hypothetical protein